jgi:hypothetical protein
MTTPTQVPDTLLAGDTWEWTREVADYPAGTWAGVYYFEKGDANFSASASQSGTSFAVSVAAATTAGYRSGKYRWRLAVTSGAVRKTVEEGWLEVLPDPAAAGNVDHRTTARVMLDNIEAYLRDPGNLVAANYALAGRSLSRWARADLLVERDKLLAEIRAEDAAARNAAGLGNSRRLYARFDRV